MREQLITENMKLAHYILNRFRNTGLDPEELYATALLGLVKAARAYEPQKHIKFATFAAIVMQNEIKMYMRSERKHSVVTTSLQAETIEDCTFEDIIPDKYRFEDAVERRMIIRNIMDDATPRERTIIRMMVLENATQKQIGYRIGLSQTMVCRILRDIKKTGGNIYVS